MGKKPLVGLVGLCVLGAALVGCRPNSQCCGNGKACPAPAGTGAPLPPPSWNNTPAPASVSSPTSSLTPRSAPGGALSSMAQETTKTTALPTPAAEPDRGRPIASGTGIERVSTPTPTHSPAENLSPAPLPVSPTLRQTNRVELPPVPGEGLTPPPALPSEMRNEPRTPERLPEPPPPAPPVVAPPAPPVAPPPPGSWDVTPPPPPPGGTMTHETSYPPPPPPPGVPSIPTVPVVTPGTPGDQ